MLGLEGVADFTASTIHNYVRDKWTDISLELPDYVSTRMVKERMIYEEGGDYLVWPVQVSYANTVRESGLYDPDITDTDDSLVQASVPWRKLTGNYSYDMDLDVFQSSDRVRILRFITLKEHEMQNAYAEKIESATWGAPTSTSASDKRAMGIPFWVKKDTTTPAGALTGGNPTGFSDGAAGIDSTMYDQWRNWAGQYTNVTTDDLIAKIKSAIRNTGFTAPDPHPEYGFSKAMTEIYVTETTIAAMERLAETRNDRLGGDLARYMGAVTVASTPVRHVWWLTRNETDDPVYGINWRYLRPYCKKGTWMRKTGPLRKADQHTVYNVFTDCWWNWACTNRRTQWVISK